MGNSLWLLKPIILISIALVTGKCNVSCLDSLSVGSKPMVALSIAALPGNKSHAILAMGGLDLKVHIYFGDQTGKVCKVVGGWFCHFTYPKSFLC